jgi:hypothetical protein
MYKLEGSREVKHFLGQAAARARDPRPALKSAGEGMIVQTQRRMRAGLDVHGKPFARSRGAELRGGQTLWSRGELASSVQYALTLRVGHLLSSFDLFSTDKRARVHQEGLKIVPKSAKFLTIPLRGRGGMFGQRDVSPTSNRTGSKARHFKNTFFLRRGANLLLMQHTGKEGKGSLRALFLLVRSVQMKKREWLRPDMDLIARELEQHITKGGDQ